MRSQSTILICGLFLVASRASAGEIDAMVDALGNRNLRMGASRALVRRGSQAVGPLREALKSKDADIRLWSTYTLGRMGHQAGPASESLIRILKDKDVALRQAAADALGRIGGDSPTVVSALTDALDDSADAVRSSAAGALAAFGSLAADASQPLVELLDQPSTRAPARRALLSIGPPAIPALLKSTGNPRLRYDVARIVLQIDPAAARKAGVATSTKADVDSLKHVLFDASRPAGDQRQAAIAMARIGDRGFTVLTEAFRDERTSRPAAEAFAHADASAVPPLIHELSNSSADVRATAAMAIRSLGKKAAGAVPALVGRLTDESRDVRYHAVRALHEMGAASQPAIEQLSKVILNSREVERTRQWAIKTLVVTLPKTHDAVVKALIEGAGEKQNYGVRQLAIQMLRQIDPEAAKKAGIK